MEPTPARLRSGAAPGPRRPARTGVCPRYGHLMNSGPAAPARTGVCQGRRFPQRAGRRHPRADGGSPRGSLHDVTHELAAPRGRGFSLITTAVVKAVADSPAGAGVCPRSTRNAARGCGPPPGDGGLPALRTQNTSGSKAAPQEREHAPWPDREKNISQDRNRDEPQQPCSPRPGESWNPGRIWNINPEGDAPQGRGSADN